jgi:carbon-monoxide dehydrogenase medium subunit
LKIGALSTISALEASKIIKERCAILSCAAHTIASLQIRSTATLGGNICNALPSADTPPALMVVGAKLKLTDGAAERIVPVEEFFVGPKKTILRNGELLREVYIDDAPACSGAVYIKHTLRRAMEIAVVGVAVMISADSKRRNCENIKIAYGAVAPTPVRAREAEAIVKGKQIDNNVADEAGRAAVNEIKPISDFRSSAEYRRELVKILTSRAIMEAWQKAIS